MKIQVGEIKFTNLRSLKKKKKKNPENIIAPVPRLIDIQRKSALQIRPSEGKGRKKSERFEERRLSSKKTFRLIKEKKEKKRNRNGDRRLAKRC